MGSDQFPSSADSTVSSTTVSLSTTKSLVLSDEPQAVKNTNAKNAREEINYLRQQLIIGQSTLDSVLSAEARLYEAEARSINFASDQYIAEITILTALGLLAPIFEVE